MFWHERIVEGSHRIDAAKFWEQVNIPFLMSLVFDLSFMRQTQQD